MADEDPGFAGKRRALLGTWTMLSWTREETATGRRSDAFGPSPRGFITYTDDGRVMVLVIKRDRPRPAALPPTDAEKRALFDSMFAYSGTFEVQDDRVIHVIDASWNEAWTGTRQIRFLELNGNRLTYRSPPAPDPMDGAECVYRVEFEKVR
jgi:hypothetical protein